MSKEIMEQETKDDLKFELKDKENNSAKDKVKEGDKNLSHNIRRKNTNFIDEMKNKLKQHKFLDENFEVIDYIGSGSESKVFKLAHKKIKKNFALKLIQNNKKAKKNINEIKITSKLKHKNIINLYGYFTSKEDNLEIYLLENAVYGNLRQFQTKYLRREVLSETFLCYIIHEILNGLYYCHQRKIAHMDIKPQNIVIDEYLNIKIIDFSISTNYAGKNPNDEIKLPFKGTNFYMSSEVINSKKIKYKDLNKIDLYALGVLLFNFAFGYYPYNLKSSDDNYEIIDQKINGELEIKNDKNLSKPFIDFIKRILEKDINKRMSIYEAVNHDWVKGIKYILNEKEKLNNFNLFIIKLMTDGIKEFNDYLEK